MGQYYNAVIEINGNKISAYISINEELKQYSEKLANRKQIIVANKIDSMQDENLYNDLEKLAKQKKAKS